MNITGPQATRYCTICGALATTGSAFCRECGRALDVPSAPASLAYCRDCGGEVALGDRYCPKCGRPQAANVPARPEPTPPAPPAPSVHVEVVQRGEPDFAVRLLWFLFIGLWLGAAVTVVAWMAIVTVIGLPIGLWVANRLPTVMTLKPPRKVVQVRSRSDGTVVVSEERPTQLAFGTRAVYFGLIGWWFSLLWMLIAYSLAVLIVPLPLSMWMMEQVPAITTLERY